MNGKKGKMAIGKKPIKIGEEEYDTVLYVDDTADYIKTLQRLGLKLQFYAGEKDIDNVMKTTDELVDYKRDFVKQALINAGKTEEEASLVIGDNIKDVIGDGKIEVWLGFATEKELNESKKLKN